MVEKNYYVLDLTYPSAKDNFLDDTIRKSYNDDIVCDLSRT